ncbi:DUF1045 domain-containing protein [Chromobacterium sp. IIBBL 290-4]|uniref:DUF1045 domain-containing protein n=1 Tax=Chromobacterium sp. IIBBL 290-4 TaxID=2953890 RepID=UPI0020B8C0E6|nr:DUF1045 domain-containing protein [Chromobacterium sp. IIBBL 290-4]UTH74834.1 DUF1045 domain-containing protein [Chromobacterium sp. IIBBL 290-4]
MRYALYYAPRPDGDFWRAGCEWLGADACTGERLTQPAVEGAPALAVLTREAARYGWHATLKAPFVLSADVDQDALIGRTAALAQTFQPFSLPLQVAWLGDFLALRPQAESPALDELAAACVVALAPLADRSATLKARAGLNDRQQALYRRWGYPYVFEQFRFHQTLSDKLDRESETAAALERAARRHFAGLLDKVEIAGLALFIERGQGEPFRYLAYCGFDGEVARYEC